jgi:phenylacetic acid degradation operon negative regulatory protein
MGHAAGAAPPATPATPARQRLHAAAAPSARGLLFTLLGVFALPGDGTAWTSAVIAALGRLGVEEKAARQALMRTAAAGWLRAEKAGRRTRWHLTGAGRRLLTDGAERIYTFTGATEDWDGRWLLVAARIQGSDRRARHVAATRLSWAGFGSLGPGLWISTHPEREAEVTRVLQDAGIAGGAHLFAATRSGLAPVSAMVSAAWDLAAIEKGYQQFLAEFSSRDQADQMDQVDPADPAARLVGLVHAWRRLVAIDPALPRELLPARWIGVQAASLFADRYERWGAEARIEWKRLNDIG